MANRFGGQLRRLTENTVWDRLPAWSPDGDWIIYSSDTRRDQTLDLYRTRLSDGERQLVYSDQWRNSHARYSPDGKHIVFTAGPSVRDASTWEIRLIERETGASKLLTDNAVRDASPAFSPDGQRIVYVTNVGGARALASMDLAGGDRRILYTGPGSVWSANYSPDGRFLWCRNRHCSRRRSAFSDGCPRPECAADHVHRGRIRVLDSAHRRAVAGNSRWHLSRCAVPSGKPRANLADPPIIKPARIGKPLDASDNAAEHALRRLSKAIISLTLSEKWRYNVGNRRHRQHPSGACRTHNKSPKLLPGQNAIRLKTSVLVVTRLRGGRQRVLIIKEGQDD